MENESERLAYIQKEKEDMMKERHKIERKLQIEKEEALKQFSDKGNLTMNKSENNYNYPLKNYKSRDLSFSSETKIDEKIKNKKKKIQEIKAKNLKEKEHIDSLKQKNEKMNKKNKNKSYFLF